LDFWFSTPALLGRNGELAKLFLGADYRIQIVFAFLPFFAAIH